MSEHDWLVVPGERVGRIVADSTAESLRQAYGDASLLLDEGLPTGAGLIPFGDPGSMLDVTWADAKRRRGVREVRAAYGRFQWRTTRGVRHAMSVAEMEALTGAPLTFAAGGEVEGGKGLLPELGKTLFLTFKPAAAAGLSESAARRYLVGPPWSSSAIEMAAVTGAMRLAYMRVVLDHE